MLPLQRESAVLACQVLLAQFGVCLGEVEESECIAVLDLLVIDAAFVKEAESSALGLK